MSHEEHAIFESMVSHDHSTVLETESGQLIFVDDMPRLAADEALHSAHTAFEGSDATNRSLQHICFKSFIFYTVALAALRTGVLHPMNLTVTRKMTAPQDAAKSTQTILRELAARPGGPFREWTRGMLAAVLGCSASDALYYGVYEPAKHYMTQRNYGGAAECASGYVGDVVSRSLHTPAMVIMTKQVLQPATERPLGVAGMVRHTYQTGGTKALFRGFTASVAAGSPWSALWWLAYERSKAALYGAARASPVSMPERWKRRLPSTMTNLNDNGLLNAGASMLASASTAVMFNPFLVVRARQQQLNMSIRHAARLVRQEGGWRGYMAGVQLSVASCVVDGILISYTYELAKSLAEIKHPSK